MCLPGLSASNVTFPQTALSAQSLQHHLYLAMLRFFFGQFPSRSSLKACVDRVHPLRLFWEFAIATPTGSTIFDWFRALKTKCKAQSKILGDLNPKPPSNGFADEGMFLCLVMRASRARSSLHGVEPLGVRFGF